jgi:tRNA-dihydrouridine synthase B
LITTLQLGNKTFPNNIIQGPLAGLSCAPFRTLTWRYSKPAFSCTEMISAKTLLHKTTSTQRRYLEKDPEEGPVCFQIAGNNPYEIAEAVKCVTEQGADLIDLNCGCPVKKIRKKGAGSSLLSDASTLYQLITAMKQNTSVPISIKIRVEGKSGDTFNKEIAKVVRDAGTDYLIVHGRHWTEHYETPCNYPDIQFFVEELNIPVIGNGDVSCLTTLHKMFATGCAGIMIGRAGVGQPWLIDQLITEFQNKSFTKPSCEKIGALFIEHSIKLADLLSNEKFAVFQARTFAKYYARDLTNRKEFCDAINNCTMLKELIIITKNFFCTP